MRALKRARTKRLARLATRVYYLRKRGREQEMYNLICDEFVSLGGVYVKFLQGVLFSTPVMKRWHSPSRLHIFEKLDSEPIDVVQLLRQELSEEQLRQITLVQPEPFAAGSFGQVYLAQHANGKQVVVKVLRPLVGELLKFDLRLLGWFGRRFAAKEYSNITIRMSSAIKDFRQATLTETDYVTEAHFAHDLFESYRGHPRFVIPETYLDLCTPHIIVQEFINGISVAELLERKEHGTDPRAYVWQQLGSDLVLQMETLGVECLTSAFSLPRIQGDPHPGNVRLLPDNRVGIIDFGIAAPAPHNKAAFYGILEQWNRVYNEDGDVAGLFEQFMRFFVNDLYRALKKLSVYMPAPPAALQGLQDQAANKLRNGDMLREVGHVVQNLFEGAMGTHDIQAILSEGRLLSAFGQMVNKNNRLGLVVHLQSSEILRAAQTYVAMIEALGLRNELLPRILEQSVERVQREHSDIIHESDHVLSMSQSLDIVNRWLERVATRDPVLFRTLLKHINVARQVAVPLTAPASTSKEESTHA
jgi:hypothetical protein